MGSLPLLATVILNAVTDSVLVNTFQPGDTLPTVNGSPPGSWGYTLSSSSGALKGPIGAPPRLRLLFETRSRDGTPCYFLVTLRRQKSYLLCCGGRSVLEVHLHSSVKESKAVPRQAKTRGGLVPLGTPTSLTLGTKERMTLQLQVLTTWHALRLPCS